MVKAGEKISYTNTNSNNNNCPKFFKIYMPELLSKRLKIPRAFVKNFNGALPLKSVLHSYGMSWRVSGKMVDNNFFLEKGWPKFVKDNDIEFGDFLLFSYIGFSEFDVSIYGRNALRKESPFDDNCQATESSMSGDKNQEDSDSEAAAFVSSRPFFQVVLQKSYFKGNYLRISKEVSQHMKSRRPNCKLQLSNKSWVVNLTGYDYNKLQFSGGLGLFYKDNHLQVGDACTFELIERDNYVFNVYISRCH